jgi:PAS domain S-box-containing protein
MVGFNQNITKQREAELKTIESEIKYRHLFENNPMPMWVIAEGNYEILAVNEAAIRHYGYSRNEFLSMTALELRPEDEKIRFLAFDRTSPIPNASVGKWSHVKKDSSLIDVEIFAHPIDYEGKSARLILANDITEVTKAQGELQKSIEALEIAHKSQKSILDALPANIALLDSQGNIVSVNNGWKEFARENRLKSKNYAIGDNYIATAENADGEEREYGLNISRGIEGVIARRIDHFSMVYPCHSPRLHRWFRVEVAALHDRMETGAVVMHIDITDRKMAEIAANELNEQLSDSIRQISDYKTALDQSSIVSITDHQGTITYANDNFCKVSKYSHEELIGQDHRLVSSGYHTKSFIKNLWDTISHGNIWKGELKNRAKDGSTYWVDTTILPFLDENGKPYQYMSIRSDITERKKAEEQIMQLTQTLEKKVEERTSQLEQSIKELESFSYSVSHDLRAPLRIINGYSALLIEEYKDKLEPDALDYIRTVSENATQMGQLIEDLLNLSRLGLESIEKSDVDMHTLVEVILHEQRNANVQFPQVTVAKLPSSMCSQNLLKQVWINLIANAVKYSSKKENPDIHIGSYLSEGECIYFIRDNGAGFDMKYASRLFGVFQRLHSKQEFEGTGVGLALIHRIITRHGGRVWAEGKVNEGATFYFSLPR